MYINNEKRITSYNTMNTTNNMVNRDTTSPTTYKTPKRDTLELSSMGRTMPGILDKGTAAHTTLYVDYSTFRQIANYTTNNPDCEWDEMGIDHEKRWIVVNGQRFESPLSEEEKRTMKKGQMTLLDYMEESRKLREEILPKQDKYKKVELDFTNNSDFDNIGDDPKIANLLKNEKVMNMLKDISKLRGGKISLSPTL
ncbi:hypothetical protein [Metabacillus fastidiosus]|uniref:Uncharacterized protein n=1 Tax=Metabacillus fastidiosus TaxID=1458 RepID=A0ABU6P454_9BACI|nr:hypothetical protein [Metabacillus fastidiosus]